MSFEDEPIDEVGDALGLTIEVLADSIGDMKAATAQALDDSRYDTVRRATDRLEELETFLTKVRALHDEWMNSAGFGGPAVSPPIEDKERAEPGHPTDEQTRTYHGRVARGTRTPEPAFRRPLLEVLVDAGGSLPTSEALDRVGEHMGDHLNDVDRQTLPSDPRQVRWRNTAQWSRNILADEGYIDRSVRGVWRITDAGREWLARQS